MELEETVDELAEDESPWLIFEVKGVLYALNCSKVQSIMQKPEEDGAQTYLPDAPEYIRSMFKIRDDIVPALELRRLYGITSVEEEYNAFREMIDRRKSEHAQWMSTLKQCVATGEEFTLARDPHECAFGKWFYRHLEQREEEDQVIEFVLRKVEAPHRKLHEMADKTLIKAQKGDGGASEEERQALLRQAEEKLMPKILTLLDEVKKAFQHRYQEKLIVVEDGDRRIAVIVDDVKAIDMLDHVEGREEFSAMMCNRYIYSVGRGKKIDDIVLMIKAEELLELVHHGRNEDQQE